MKEYSIFFAYLSYVVVISAQFLPSSYMYIGQAIVFSTYVIIYFLGDNKSTEYLRKLTYSIIFAILLFFFLTINIKTDTYWGISENNLHFSELLVLLKSVFLFYIMLRYDRLHHIETV
jgi:hypothetical protein